MLTESKAQTISKMYFDEGGFGSMKNTFIDAKKKIPQLRILMWSSGSKKIQIRRPN